MNTERLLQHFERISEAPDAVPRLRRFILDLAVRGKLVEQDPKDEPATELLKRIQAEKARLVKDEKIKQEKPIQSRANGSMPIELPKGWLWGVFKKYVLQSQMVITSHRRNLKVDSLLSNR